MLKEFKEFAMRGNVVDMAVGIIIGAAFGTIVKSLDHKEKVRKIDVAKEQTDRRHNNVINK